MEHTSRASVLVWRSLECNYKHVKPNVSWGCCTGARELRKQQPTCISINICTKLASQRKGPTAAAAPGLTILWGRKCLCIKKVPKFGPIIFTYRALPVPTEQPPPPPSLYRIWKCLRAPPPTPQGSSVHPTRKRTDTDCAPDT